MKEFLVTPKAGSVPFVSAVVFKYKGSNCTGFTLDWGDGSEPIRQYAQSSSCDDYTVKKTAKHTYVKQGDFRITLTAQQNGRSDIRMQAVHSGTSVAQHFDISPTEGDAPLLVGTSFLMPDNDCASYKIDWGDGSQDTRTATADTCAVHSNVKTISITHTYTNTGQYTMKLYLGSGAIDSLPVVEQRQITVENSGQGANSRQATISVSPTSGVSPLVTRVVLKGTDEACASYLIDWGDGTAPQRHEASEQDSNSSACNGTPFTKEFVHTYFIPGTYTLKTKVGTKALSLQPYEYQYIVVNSANTQ